MRFGPKEKFWITVDPTPDSSLADVCFACSLSDLELQFRGGLKMDMNPTLFTSKAEAEADANARLFALRAGKVLAYQPDSKTLARARRVALMDEDGKVVFEAIL